MELMVVAEQIEKIIIALKKEGKRSASLIEEKARAAEAYDKAMGVNTAALRASGQPSTLIKDLARKDASEKLYKKIVTEETLKAHYCRMENLRAQMNGYQSINRHLENVAH